MRFYYWYILGDWEVHLFHWEVGYKSKPMKGRTTVLSHLKIHQIITITYIILQSNFLNYFHCIFTTVPVRNWPRDTMPPLRRNKNIHICLRQNIGWMWFIICRLFCDFVFIGKKKWGHAIYLSQFCLSRTRTLRKGFFNPSISLEFWGLVEEVMYIPQSYLDSFC